MNKHLYRVIFSKTRGQMVVVADNIPCRGKSSGKGRGTTKQVIIATLRLLRFSVLLALGGTSFFTSTANAQVVADQSAPAAQQPIILNSANGTPLVNIQTPSGAGVSHNTYSQFDVNQKGVILNNSRENFQSQLGGWVQVNPNLAAGTARIILNEVNSASPSLLHGYVETAGDRAQVIIANPAGVSCNGCGFINANRVTLTTGSPIMNNGNLDGYRVQSGIVSVEGDGLNSSQSDYTDIIARSVEVNAGVWANNLNVVAGANQVSTDLSQVTAIAGSGSASSVAIDVAALGGMYAGKIRLIGTQAGVGVRNAGNIGASVGELTLTADGKLINTGSIYAEGNATLSTGDDLTNQGIIAAQGDLTLSGTGSISHIDNTGSLIRSGGSLTVTANSVSNDNTQSTDKGLEGNNVSISAKQISNDTGAIRANNALNLNATTLLDNQSGLISSKATLAITDTSSGTKNLVVTNTGGNIVASQSLSVDTATLSGDGSVVSSGDLSIVLTGNYTHTGVMQADANLDFSTAGNLENQSGISAGNKLILSAGQLTNTSTGQLIGKSTTISGASNITNRGLIDGETSSISANTVDNLGLGRIYGDHLAIEASTLNNNAESGISATLAARDRLDLGVQTLNNGAHSTILSLGDLAIGHNLDSNGFAIGKAGTINNNSAYIEAMDKLSVTATQLNNINTNFTTKVEQQGGPEAVVEYQGSGSPNRYLSGTPDVYVYNNESDHLHTPEGNFETWNRYNYSRTTTETVVATTDPAHITVGNALELNIDTLVNDKSEIIAGGLISGDVGDLQNVAVGGKRTFTDVGSVTTFWRNHEKGIDSTGSSSTAYNPAQTITDISLGPSVYKENSTPAAGGTSITPLADTSVTAVVDSITLPNSSLYQLINTPDSTHLIETDPRFTSYRTWFSSDYMLTALSYDPAVTQKRLGDGFYEQTLIRDQIAKLTGSRYLSGFNDDQSQYQALMNAGITSASEFALIPGVTLSEAQVAQLTSDIVWLVEKTVTLPDGSLTQALVPQIYLAVREGDLSPSGALISGENINWNLTGDINNSGTIAGRSLLKLNAENINNVNGQLHGDTLVASARNDLNNIGGKIIAKSSLTATAGHDLNLSSSTNSKVNAQGRTTNIARLAGLYVTGSEGTLLAFSGNDFNLAAADISSAGSTALAAGHNLNFNTVSTQETHNIAWDSQNQRSDATRQDVGSNIKTNGDLSLIATNDLTARAASLSSIQGNISLTAGNNLSLTTGQTEQTVDEAHYHKEKGFLSSKSINTRDKADRTTALATTISGISVSLNAGHNLSVTGSNVASTQDVNLTAGNNFTMDAAKQTNNEIHLIREKKSGFLSSGGIGITIGSQMQTTIDDADDITNLASTIGSTDGNVTINADKIYTQTGSDVLALKGDIDITAQKVAIQNAIDTSDNEHTTKFKQSGLTVALSSPVISAVQTVQQMKKASSESSDPRLKALALATAAVAAKNGYDATQADPEAGGGVSLSITVGSSSSKSITTQTSQTVAGSTVSAGGNIAIKAIGDDKNSSMTVQGSDVSAGHDVSLKADGDINLLAAANTADLHTTRSSKSGGVGVAITYGSDGAAFGVTANANASRGKDNGADVAWTNSHVIAGNTLTLESGNDTTLKGAVASGQKVIAGVGGDLNIESLQDTSTYTRRDQVLGGSVTSGFGFSASANYSKSAIDSDYASVVEQSAIKAGDEGFLINVNGNTDLKGAVIAANDQAVQDNKNSITTDTLTTSTIENSASAKVKASSIGSSFDGKIGKYASLKALAKKGLTGGNESESDSSFTFSAIEASTIQIMDDAKQQENTGKNAIQTIEGLNRDTQNANKPLAKIDINKLEERVQAEQAIKQATFNIAVKFTDESYRTMFLKLASVNVLLQDEEGNTLTDENGKALFRELTLEEKKNLQQSADGRVHIANNGINNTIEAAAKYANQHSTADGGPQYFIYFPIADNSLSELIIAGYQKFLENEYTGFTNATQETINAMQDYGKSGLHLDSHSRGGLTTGNALEFIGDTSSVGVLADTRMNFVGSAYNALQADNLLGNLQGRDLLTDVETLNNMVVQQQTHQVDFVGHVLGGNPATGGTIPEGSSFIDETLNIFSGAHTVHSCYGVGEKQCQARWGESLIPEYVPVSTYTKEGE